MIAMRQRLQRARRRRIVGWVCVILLVLLVVLVSLHLGEDAQHATSTAAVCLVAIVGLLLAVRCTAPLLRGRLSIVLVAAPRPPPRAPHAAPPASSSALPLLL